MTKLLLIPAMMVVFCAGCRCIYVKTGDIVVFGCSIFSDTGIENAVIEPNSIKSGIYRGDTDRIKFIYPPVYIETE